MEVALALGIASFVLISLLGLMTASVDAGKKAYEDTTVASIAQTVISQIKTNSFADLTNHRADGDRFFTYDGEALGPANNGNGYYRCKVVTSAHNSPELPAAMKNGAQGQRVRMLFFWPPENPKTNEVFETTISRF